MKKTFALLATLIFGIGCQAGAETLNRGIPVPAVERRNFAVIHPFASSLSKRWPLENFREVAANLHGD